jgi:hypothetical protein
LELHPIVRAEIEKRFSPADAGGVIAELESAPSRDGRDAWHAYGRARVQLAILKAANGDMARFRIALAVSREDFRDVLVMAGLQEDDWPAVLTRAGFRVPPPPPGPRPVPEPSAGSWQWAEWLRVSRVLLFAILVLAAIAYFAELR